MIKVPLFWQPRDSLWITLCLHYIREQPGTNNSHGFNRSGSCGSFFANTEKELIIWPYKFDLKILLRVVVNTERCPGPYPDPQVSSLHLGLCGGGVGPGQGNLPRCGGNESYIWTTVLGGCLGVEGLNPVCLCVFWAIPQMVLSRVLQSWYILGCRYSKNCRAGSKMEMGKE